MSIGAYRPLLRVLSPAGRRARLFVFIFHRVVATHDALLPVEPDAGQFDWMVRFIGRNFTVLPFGEAVDRLGRGELPAAAASITFDDGYHDNFSVALPILRRHGLPATFFIATGFLDGGRMWNDDIIAAVRASHGSVDWSQEGLGRHELGSPAARLACLGAVLGRLKYFPHKQRSEIAQRIARRSGVAPESALMMRTAEVRALRAAGMEVGAHTRTHPILSRVDDDQAWAEIAGGKADLEAILGEPVHVFAYPNGNPQRDMSAAHVDMIRSAGFRAAATTAHGVGRQDTEPLLMPRFTPWDRSPFRFAARCALVLGASHRAAVAEDS